MNFKNFLATITSLLVFIIFIENTEAEEKYSQIAWRIAGRAEVIKERAASFYEIVESYYNNLYYFIISTLEDANGLFCLGDNQNSVYKLLILDAVTYDLVCAGATALFEINKSTGELQKSEHAASLEKFKELVENKLQLITKRGLQESVYFTETEERIFAIAANKIIKNSKKIKNAENNNMIKDFLSSVCAIDKENIKFRIPDSIPPPLTNYFIAMMIDNKWGLLVNIYFQNETVKTETLLLALFNLFVYEEGLAINNNESLESQIHYILTQMRMSDWILKNASRFGIKDTSILVQYKKWFQDAFERLAEESFMPQYYDRLFKIKQTPVVKRISFDWNAKSKLTDAANTPRSDDYIFYLMGNGSQMPANIRLKNFIETNQFPDGTAFDLGCGDGSNTRLLAKSGFFKNVVAIDHSKIAVERIKRLELLEHGLKNKIRPVHSDIMEYKYPSKNAPVYQRASLVVIDNVMEFLTIEKRIALLQNLKNLLLSQGVIYIEYHLADGQKFHDLKSNPKNKMTDNNDLITENEFQGKQIKHFYKKGEFSIELDKANINTENGFSIKENFADENGFKIGIAVIKKH